VIVIGLVLSTIAMVYFNVILVGLNRGFPILIGAERFNYWSEVSNPFARVFINFHASIAVLLGSCLVFGAMTLKSRRLTIGALILCGVHFVLMLFFGFKQTSFSLSATLMMVPIMVSAVINGYKPPLRNFAIWMSLILLVSVMTAVLSYSGYTITERLTQLSARIALQGQLWHLADAAISHEPFDLRMPLAPEVVEWGSFTFRPAHAVGFEFGLYRIMQEFAAPDVLFYYTRDQIGFIFALFPGWLLFYGYPITAFLVMGAGVVWGLTFRLVLLALQRGSYLALLPLALTLMMQSAAHIDGMSYRIFGLQIWILIGMAVLGLTITAKPTGIIAR
jgi:hypothetical protein